MPTMNWIRNALPSIDLLPTDSEKEPKNVVGNQSITTLFCSSRLNAFLCMEYSELEDLVIHSWSLKYLDRNFEIFFNKRKRYP